MRNKVNIYKQIEQKQYIKNSPTYQRESNQSSLFLPHHHHHLVGRQDTLPHPPTTTPLVVKGVPHPFPLWYLWLSISQTQSQLYCFPKSGSTKLVSNYQVKSVSIKSSSKLVKSSNIPSFQCQVTEKLIPNSPLSPKSEQEFLRDIQEILVNY